jgi:hypothetical protein
LSAWLYKIRRKIDLNNGCERQCKYNGSEGIVTWCV